MIQKVWETCNEWNRAHMCSEFQDAQGELRSELGLSSSEWEHEIRRESGVDGGSGASWATKVKGKHLYLGNEVRAEPGMQFLW